MKKTAAIIAPKTANLQRLHQETRRMLRDLHLELLSHFKIKTYLQSELYIYPAY